jgi:cullin 1
MEPYYALETSSFLSKNRFAAYVVRAEQRLQEGKMRSKTYGLDINSHDFVRTIHGSKKFLTYFKFISRCEHVLIRQNTEKLRDYFQQLLAQGKEEELERLSALLFLTPDCLSLFHNLFEAHVKANAESAILALLESSPDSASIEPGTYVNALYEVYRLQQEAVGTTFRKDVRFAAALDRACTHFVNRNAATGAAVTKAPELLVKCVDSLLREGIEGAQDDQIEQALDNVVSIFTSINIRVSDNF